MHMYKPLFRLVGGYPFAVLLPTLLEAVPSLGGSRTRPSASASRSRLGTTASCWCTPALSRDFLIPSDVPSEPACIINVRKPGAGRCEAGRRPCCPHNRKRQQP